MLLLARILLPVTGHDGSLSDICTCGDGQLLSESLVEEVLFLLATGGVVKFNAMLNKFFFIFLTSS